MTLPGTQWSQSQCVLALSLSFECHAYLLWQTKLTNNEVLSTLPVWHSKKQWVIQAITTMKTKHKNHTWAGIEITSARCGLRLVLRAKLRDRRLVGWLILLTKGHLTEEPRLALCLALSASCLSVDGSGITQELVMPEQCFPTCGLGPAPGCRAVAAGAALQHKVILYSSILSMLTCTLRFVDMCAKLKNLQSTTNRISHHSENWLKQPLIENWHPLNLDINVNLVNPGFVYIQGYLCRSTRPCLKAVSQRLV